MKEAIIHPGIKVDIVDSPIPTPGPTDVITKVVFSGSNPKDWKVPDWTQQGVNQGDDIAGIVHAVGSEVTEFKPGDRVAAFHEMLAPGGSYAEYALSPAHTTFHIPASTGFEEAASIPLAAMTAAVGLYLRLGLPEPWIARRGESEGERQASSSVDDTPLLVWGGGSAVGSYVIQLAQRSNIHPVIVVAGRAQEHARSLIDASKGDVVLDYREGDDALIPKIQQALNGKPLRHVYDAVSEHGSYQAACKVLANPGGAITLVLPNKKYDDIPEGITQSITMVGCVHGSPTDQDFGYVWFRYLGRGLREGWFKGHPTEIVPGGLGGVKTALENLKAGKASAVKYIFKIADTEGAEKSSP